MHPAPSPSSVALNGLAARLEGGRRGLSLEVTGELTLPAGGAVDGLSLFIAVLDAERRFLAVEDARPDPELAADGRLVFCESLRLSSGLAEAVHGIEVWAVAQVQEVAHAWELAGDALADPGPGGRSIWRGAGVSVVRAPVESDGDVRITVHGRCPLVPGAGYARSGELQLTVVDGAGGVLCHEDTSFPTLGGGAAEVTFSERLRPHVGQLQGGHAFRFRLLTTRAVSSPRCRLEREQISFATEAG